ncbi:hypothetical protein BB560_004488, partial [Smittium megazygosporum]
MANASAKKTIVSNSAKIKRMDKMYLAVNCLYVLFRFIIFYSSLSWKIAVCYFITLAIESYIYVQIYRISQPKFDNDGKLISSGVDLSQPGLISYMFDVIYITWMVHLLSLITVYAWFLYLSIPIYILYEFGGKFISLIKNKSPEESEQPKKSKRMEKMEKRKSKV